MAVTPLLLEVSRRLAHRFEPAPQGGRLGEQRDHVVIAGYGRVGETLALLLESRGTPYLALDVDPDRVSRARARDLPVYYGDARRTEVLRAAALERALAVVITVDEPDAAGRTVQVVRALHPELPVLARARDLEQCERLARAGVTAVVPEVVEGSLQLGAALLRQLGASRDEVDQTLEEFRRETYARLGTLAEGEPEPTGPAGAPR
jgi:CPA2 family monovalent cation:H+ antiporter-2